MRGKACEAEEVRIKDRPLVILHEVEHFDVIIVGAGISGIGTACHLSRLCPGKSYAILEGRDTLGGTWDLFRYPGIRSDSDMHTLGYSFKPWTEAKAIADGPAILDYINQTAVENRLKPHIRFNHRVKAASWSSEEARWTLEIERPTGEPVSLSCGFLSMCSGYFSYESGFTPEFDGVDDYRGHIIHPQKWPENFDYRGKRVVVIGSGATAMTLVPAMAADAAHVTMLQRSPTYVVSRPDQDAIANWLRKLLPERLAYALTRFKNIRLQRMVYDQTRTAPEKVKKKLLDLVRKALPADYDIETHFTPSYDPWDQRLCLLPNGDLFEAIRNGKASVVTDQIDRFSETGIQLQSGEKLETDVVVTATGLNLKLLGGAQFSVDGRADRFRRDRQLQGDDVLRRAQPGADVRLHQRLLDAPRRPERGVHLPRPQPHGRTRRRASAHPVSAPRTPTCRRGTGFRISPRATCSAKCTSSRSRAIANPGSTRRTSRETRRCSATRPSKTACCSSLANARRIPFAT